MTIIWTMDDKDPSLTVSLSQCLLCQYGQTALIFAAHHGHADLVTFLVDRGANIDARNNVSHTWCWCFFTLPVHINCLRTWCLLVRSTLCSEMLLPLLSPFAASLRTPDSSVSLTSPHLTSPRMSVTPSPSLLHTNTDGAPNAPTGSTERAGSVQEWRHGGASLNSQEVCSATRNDESRWE